MSAADASDASPFSPQEWRRFQTARGLRLGCLSAPLVVVGVGLAAWFLSGDLVGGGGTKSSGALETAALATAALALGLGLVAALLPPLAFWLRGGAAPPEGSAAELRASEPFVRPLQLLVLVGCLVGAASLGILGLGAAFREPPSERELALERVTAGTGSAADLAQNFDLLEVLRRLRDLRESGSGDPSQLLEVLTQVDQSWPHAERVRAELQAWSATDRLSPASKERVSAWLGAK